MRRLLSGMLTIAFVAQSSGPALASYAERSSTTETFWSTVLQSIGALSQLMAYPTGSNEGDTPSQPVARRAMTPPSFISTATNSNSSVLGEIYGSNGALPGNNPRETDVSVPVQRSPKFIRPAAQSADHDDISKSRLSPLHLREGVVRSVKYPKSPPTKTVPDPLALRMYAKYSSTRGAAGTTLSNTSSAIRIAGGTRLKSSPSFGQLLGARSAGMTDRHEKLGKRMLATTDLGAGMNRYWTYEGRSIPGVGEAMVNVGTGNLVLQSSDFDIPERGLDLVMRRTYNSQSLHDANGDDGSEAAIFGNGWTNTYDAHLVLRSNGEISVYDIDGTRCDYTPTSGGTWTPCTGQHATLEIDPNAPCSYWLIKKSGTAYWFDTPYPGNTNCSVSPGNIGRVYAIYGRNSYNAVTLVYSFVSGQPQTAENITEIDVNHSNLQSIVMKFGQANQTGPNELASITLPDGAHVNYSYDSSGDLGEVDRTDGNDAASVLSETYGTQAPIQAVCGPRATLSGQTDGACMHFDYDGMADLIDWKVNGILNFDPNDGFGKLQSYPTAWQTWYTANFEYGAVSNPPCSEAQAGTTTLCDVDGHNTVWTVNGVSQVTKMQTFTGPSTSLLTKQSWDPVTYDLTSVTDARGNETDYGYDINGNTVEVWQPSQPTSKGNLRPLSLYSYDGFNNITAYCDPLSNGAATPPPVSDSMCKTQQGQFQFTYTYPSYEPFGELTRIDTPCKQAGSCTDGGGDETNISYSPGPQGGSYDYGLPTSAIGRSYQQQDGTTRSPEQDFTYNSSGLLKTYVTGSPEPGQGGQGTWIISYSQNNMNRVVSRTDPDGYTSHTCYQPDGSIYYTETPYQYFLDGQSNCATASPAPGYADSFNHDADGDVIAEYKNHSGRYTGAFGQPTALPSTQPNGVAKKNYYDGEDRLVEVIQPPDKTYDVFANPWITRYLYDITQEGSSGNLSFQGASGSFAAYGNLYKTQEILPSATSDDLTWGNAPTTPGSSPAPFPTILNNRVTDISALAYDSTDRPIDKYRIVNKNHNEQVAVEQLTYDSDSAHLGLLDSDCQLSVSECQTFSYDAVSHITQYAFSPSQNTLTRNVTYDPDGREEQVMQQGGNNDTDIYTYDLDGRVMQVGKGTGRKITYGYYYDGKRDSVGGTLGPNSLLYSYAPDGTLQQLNYNLIDKNDSEYYGHMAYTLSAAGRVTERDDYSQTVGPMKTKRSYAHGLLSEEDYYCQSPCNGQSLPGSHQQLQYTAEGELLGQLVTAPWSFPPTGGNPSLNQYAETWYYNTRGELLARFDHLGETEFKYADGVQVASYPKQQYGRTSTFLGAQGEWDARMGASLGGGNSSQSGSQGNYIVTGQFSSVGYDVDGRNSSSGYTGFCNAQNPSGCGSPTVQQSESRTYDVENHVISAAGTYSSGAINNSSNAYYVWGADGRPLQIGSAPSNGPSGNDDLYWDGNNLLYTQQSSGSGIIDNVKIGADADFLQNDSSGFEGVTFYDRGTDGSVAFCHNLTGGSGGWGDGDASVTQTKFFNGGPSNPCGPPAALPTWGMKYPLNVAWNGSYAGFVGNAGVGTSATIGQMRADGISDGVSTIQGVRAFDSTAGQWTSPDVYSGDVKDPMSQKGYVWNGNDPVDDEDPSGYISYIASDFAWNKNWVYNLHAFVEIQEEKISEVFEYGPDDSGRIVDQPTYNSTIEKAATQPVALAPVNGLSGDALDARVASVYNGISTFLEDHFANYTDFNSNTIIAAGLLLLGYTPAQVNAYVPGPTMRPFQSPAQAGAAFLQFMQEVQHIEYMQANAEVNLGLMGSNGMNYCYSCGWSGMLAE